MWTACLFVLVLLVLLNGLAYRHAYSMTHFLPAGNGPRKKLEDYTRREKLWVLLSGLPVYRPQPDSTPASLGLSYEILTIPGAIGSLEAWYIPHPQTRGLVLMYHGYTNCKSDLLGEAGALHELGYSCLLVDFPGSGGSEGDTTTIGYREAKDVACCIDFARARWPGATVILYGQSMGASAILRALAVHGARADALILECPFDRLLTTVKARFHAFGLPAFPAARLMVFWGGVQSGYNGFSHNPVEYASAVDCPVLLLHGREDRRVTCDQVEAIYRNLRGRKQMHIFDGLGHESYVVPRREEWKRCVARFLDGKDGEVALSHSRHEVRLALHVDVSP
jgi:alpha-beta hydrolase superfamily lysophospholipase